VYLGSYYINPASSIPESSSFSAGASCGFSGAGASTVKSAELTSLIIALNWSMLSAGIRVPDFVNPVYPVSLLLTNSRIVSPVLPPKSSIRITMSVVSFFFILPMSFSMIEINEFSL